MAVDPSLPVPVYFQLKQLLLEEILSGRYGPGERLPTEHEICERYGISRTPVTRALSELAVEGVVVRHRRRGTFVNPHWAPPHGPELRVVVPEGPWARLLRDAAPAEVRLEVATVPLPDLHGFLSHAVAEGRGPDLAVLDSVWVQEFAAAGFLAPLEDFDHSWVREELEQDFLEALVASGRHGGETFAVQAEADVAGLWYRREDLSSVAAAVPSTWDELLEVGRRLTGTVRSPVVMSGGSWGGETTTYCLLALLASNGVRVFEDDAVTLASPGTVEALTFLRDLVEEDVMPSDVVAYEWDRPIRLLAEGSAAMSLGGSYEGRRIRRAAGLPMEELWEAFGFAPVPGGPHGAPASLVGGMVYAIFRQASHPKVGMRLLKDAVSPESLSGMARSTGQIPPRRSSITAVSDRTPLLSATTGMLERAVARPATPVYARVSAQLRAMLEAVLTGRLDPRGAAERTAEFLGAITGLPVQTT